MTDLTQLDPTGRFTGLAAIYAQCRPDYPAAAIDDIMTRCRLRPGAQAVDVGCGTGIATRLLARRGLCLIGIEPNAEMRTQAAAEVLPPDLPAPVYREGKAEATGLPPAVADLVLAAQAFHWFEPQAALREFHRLLQPAGWVAVLCNERDETDPFTRAFGDVIRTAPLARAVEEPRRRSGSELLTSSLFRDGSQVVWPHVQMLDEEGLLGRAFSMSYAPREPTQAERFAEALREVFARHQEQGQVCLHYRTWLTLAQRRPGF